MCAGAILEGYEAMADATRSGKRYQTRLHPAAGDPRVADGGYAGNAMSLLGPKAMPATYAAHVRGQP
jgi:hypothetical protein